jgi:type II secretory pathway pseudopilin PulG
MTRRPGLSLVEVLAAIFIMGIGLVSIFTLFPYGALQMAAALKDDRTAQSAAAADAYMRTYWKDRVVENNLGTLQFESFYAAMDDPNSDPLGANQRIPNPFQKPPPPNPPNANSTPAVSNASTDPSYPVFVDPMGWVARAAGTRADLYWVGEGTTVTGLGKLPRRTLHDHRTAATALSLRTCSMLDGLTYDPNGRAADGSGQAAETVAGVVQREMRYNWLWVLQRPNNRDRNTARMTVVVYDKRAHLFAPNSAETIFNPTFANPGQNDTRLQFSTNAPVPPVRKGSWLLDGTVIARQYPSGGGQAWGSFVRNANFYRVVSVTTDNNVVDVELATPLRADSLSPAAPTGAAWTNTVIQPAERQFYVLSGVSDVFERNPLTAADQGP